VIADKLVAEMSDEKELEEAIWLLRHRVRRRIIMTIGDAGRISATTLRDKLGISTGSLYYNLKQLDRLVTQDSKRNYVLTEEGNIIYRLLKEQGDLNLETIKTTQSKLEMMLSNIFFPIWLVAPLLDRARLSLLAGVLSITFLSALLLNSKAELIILHIYHFPNFSINSYVLKLLLSILIIYLYVSATSLIHDLMTRRSSGEEKISLRRLISMFFGPDFQWVKLICSIMISMLPLAIYPAIAFVDRVAGWGQFMSKGVIPSSMAANVTLVIAQLGAFILLTATLSYLRRLRWHVAALISFSVIYLSIVVQYIVVLGS
jgi:hypothetical protein